MKWTWLLLGCLAGCGTRELVEPLPYALPTGKAAPTATGQPQEKRVIRQAVIRVRSRDPHASAVDATHVAAAAQGVVPQNELRSTGRRVASSEIRLRVPQPAFEPTMRRLRALGTVVHESITGRDASADFDQAAHELQAERALETRLLALLERSALLKDALPVEQDLARVRADIENSERKLQALEQDAQSATIELSVEATQPPIASEPTSSRLATALSQSAEAAVAGSVWLVAASGYAMPWGVLAIVAVLFTKRLRRGRTPRPPVAPARARQGAGEPLEGSVNPAR